MARSEKKMQEKIEEIKKACQLPVECKYIVADLGKLNDISEYRALLDKEIENLDIGIVICNAGWTDAGPYAAVSDSLV